MTEEEDPNALDKWISVTGEKMARFYDLVEKVIPYFNELHTRRELVQKRRKKIGCKKIVASEEWKKNSRV